MMDEKHRALEFKAALEKSHQKMRDRVHAELEQVRFTYSPQLVSQISQRIQHRSVSKSLRELGFHWVPDGVLQTIPHVPEGLRIT